MEPIKAPSGYNQWQSQKMSPRWGLYRLEKMGPRWGLFRLEKLDHPRFEPRFRFKGINLLSLSPPFLDLGSIFPLKNLGYAYCYSIMVLIFQFLQ